MKNAKRFVMPLILLFSVVWAFVFPVLFKDPIYAQTVVLTLTLVAVGFYTWKTSEMQRAVQEQAEVSARQAEIATRQIEEITAQTQAIKYQSEKSSRQVEETAKQTNELILQRKLSLLPKFSVRLMDGLVVDMYKKPQDRIQLTNIGNGTAQNISIDDVPLTFHNDEVAHISFGKLLYLEPTKSNSGTDKHPYLPITINYAGGDPDAMMFASIYNEEPLKFFHKHGGGQPITLTIKFQDIYGNNYSERVLLKISGEKYSTSALGIPLEI
ncbi:MAG: hypothetical protein ACJ754_20140 [Pyrinomonadaceae bacterium]